MNTQHVKKQNIKRYVIGYILSIFLTVTAWYFVNQHVLSHHLMYTHEFLLYLIFSLAIMQCVIQLIFFLHMTQEKKPRWNLAVFVATIGIIVIVVIGSMWIMNHLNYNMTPKAMYKYVQSQDGF